MNQDELLKKIKKSAEAVPTPQGLSPEPMMKRLDDLQGKGYGRKKQKQNKLLRYGPATILAASAAWFLIHSVFFQAGSQLSNESAVPLQQQSETAGMKDSLNRGNKQEDIAAGGGSYAAASYEEIYEIIHKNSEQAGGGWEGQAQETAAAATEAAPEAGAGDMGSSGNDTSGTIENEYSDTNVQTEGVDEGDVVKTDGSYLYITTQDRTSIQIVKADEGQLEWIGEIKDGWETIVEFYIYENKLSVIKEKYVSGTNRQVTWLETYDLTDPSSPRLSGSVKQDGYYKASRRVDGYLYLFTGFQADTGALKEDIRGYVPGINDQPLPYECIYIPDKPNKYHYLVASSIDLQEPGKVKDQKALMADGDNFYVSQENIYCALNQYDFRANQYDYTELFKFAYADGFISYEAHGLLDGSLNDQFSMDEYEGNLRLVTTLSRQNSKTTNSLLVLDPGLNQIGSIHNMAPGEQIYSARFLGDTGYFVTFRNMDPLFSVDLSDPANPQILGELKITGFSEYLHFFTGNLLLGIGNEINPHTQAFEGLKLSMFDISDPVDVKEVHKVVEPSYQSTPAFGQHKAVLVSQSKNLIGFPVETYDYGIRQWGICYVIYSYDEEKGFTKAFECKLGEYGDIDMVRGIYIGDYLYIVNGRQAFAYRLADFEKAGQLNY